jgi:hypothetical protein
MRDELIGKLKNNVCVVVFEKKDGTERSMRCTLQEGIIPEATKEDPLSQKKIRSLNEEVIPVWDTEKNGWRSFRIDSVKSFSVLTQG